MRPLGYWIKEIDRRIEEDFGRLLADEGLTRRHWQVLHTIAQGPVTSAELDRALAPFLSAGSPTVRPQADDLADRGWALMTSDGTATLTPAGREAHDRVAARVGAARARVIEGLSEADYVTLVGLLERVAGNLAA